MSAEKFTAQAERWTDQAYADAAWYLQHRAGAVMGLGPHPALGDRVLDLACGDAGFAEPLLAAGLRYTGVDANAAMAEAARRRLGPRGAVVHAPMDEYVPDEPVAVTCCFRALYYAEDRAAFLHRVAGYTTSKLVFDIAPRRYDVREVEAELAAAGFTRIDMRPFFAPQTRAIPRPGRAALRALEQSGPLARLLLRLRFSYVVAASRPASRSAAAAASI
jgi:SAM-dependent methyltransferase